MKKVFTLMLCVFVTCVHAQLVTDDSALQTALAEAGPGTIITLANGTWTDLTINAYIEATEENPATIKAETQGQVIFEGDSHVNIGGSYVIFKGVVFQNSTNRTITIDPIIRFRTSSDQQCNNCTVTNIMIDGVNGTEEQISANSYSDAHKWVLIHGQYNEISYSSFVNKEGIGSIINDNRNASTPDYTDIHHNYFGQRTPVTGVVNVHNDQDAIRIGNSATSQFPSYTEVHDNYFEDFVGEVEIISNKSCNNKYYNNTFRNFAGTLTLRHGNNCEVYNNYFFANGKNFSGAVRVMDKGHKVYNNYLQDGNHRKIDAEGNTAGSNATGGINITNGRVASELNGYYPVEDCYIVNNTFVNSDYGIRVGTTVKNDLTIAPDNIVVANNIMYNTSDYYNDGGNPTHGSQYVSALTIQTTPTNSTIEGNIKQNGDWALTDNEDNNITVTSDLLEYDATTDMYRLTSTSPAISAGVGMYDFLSGDIFHGSRDGDLDSGAEESASNGSNIPYITADVGTIVGFGGSSGPVLNTNPSTITFNAEPQSTDITLNASVNWTISNDDSWITVSPTNGNEGTTLTITVSENIGANREGTITISEDGGDLETTVTITQQEFVPVIEVTPSEITFNKNVNSGTFEINSNVDWSIFINSDWLTVSSEDGSDNQTISFSITENTSGNPRKTSIFIIDDNSMISDTVIVTQTESEFDVDDAVSIPIVEVLGVETQEGNTEISPANVNDEDETTRWSGESPDGSAYLDLDLNCPHILTSIQIYFHKGGERTSNFKLATSTNGTDFTDATEVLTSSLQVGYQEIELTGLPVAQYVRLYGYGNSVNDWNSYEEINVFGDLACSKISVDITVLLEGAYSSNGMMKSDLATFVPTEEPYGSLNYTQIGSNSESFDASIKNQSGENSLVDWIFVELRASSDPSLIVATKSALLLSNGKVVDVDGSSSLSFDMPQGDYYIAIKHRNHISIMSSASFPLSSVPVTIDLTKISNVYTDSNITNSPILDLGSGIYCMFAGEITGEGEINSGDAQEIFSNAVPIQNDVYSTRDVDMDGRLSTDDAIRSFKNAVPIKKSHIQ